MLSIDNQPDVSVLLDDLGEYLADDPPALSLPPRAYTSPELWELERQRIFNRSWMLVAHADQLKSTGDYVALSIAGEPVVVTRADDGGLHALSPICRHRLMPLIEAGTGRTDALTCRYHLWKYGLDGQLRGAPHMAGHDDFALRDCRLPRFAVTEWNGLVWVNLDAEADPIGAHLDLAGDEFANYRLSELVQADSYSFTWRANWKLVMENGHENYHVLGLHRDTLEPFMPGSGDLYVRQYSPWVLHARIPFAAPLKPEALALNDIQKRNGMVLLAFPASAFIGTGDQVVWLSFIPLTIDTVHAVGGILTTPELAAGSAALTEAQQAFTTMVNDEDRTGLEAVQRGAHSRFAQRGHLSPKEQPGILAFYRNLAHALLGGGPAGR